MAYIFDFGTKFARLTLASALGAIAALSMSSSVSMAQGASSTLTVSVSGLRSMKGNVLVCVTANPKFFPNCSKDPKSHRARVTARNSSSIRFNDILPGTYAAALMHDENSNDKLDMAVMFPKEGFGFSRNPAVVTGPPKFKSAAFSVVAGSASQNVKMKYMF